MVMYKLLESYKKFEHRLKNLDLKEFKRDLHFYVGIFLITFCLFVRIVPPFFIGLLSILILVSIVAFDFFYYFNKKFIDSNLNELNQTEYSWGIVRHDHFKKEDLKKFFEYLRGLDYAEYKSYFKRLLPHFVFIMFIFGDIIVALKNLNIENFGIYVAFSVLTKFIFIGYYYFSLEIKKLEIFQEENLLDIFYSFINLFLTSGILIFVFMFLTSKIFTKIFFGYNYLAFQTTLPFVFLGNMMMCIALCVFVTARKMDAVSANRILKVFSVFFGVIFIFVLNSSPDSVTYFIIGSSTILSIFLYNLIIKKPTYIKNTYNHLF